MHCSKCNSSFKPEGISLLREEENFYVVKIVCTECEQPVGIAIVGIKSHQKEEDQTPELTHEVQLPDDNESPPITYDEVIDAHKFFSSLGPDWMKHLQQRANDLDNDSTVFDDNENFLLGFDNDSNDLEEE